jgi:hypothetical protein
MALQLLPGKFAIETFVKETFLTAVGGGGRTADAVYTMQNPAAWETFRIWADLENELRGVSPRVGRQHRGDGRVVLAQEGVAPTGEAEH